MATGSASRPLLLFLPPVMPEETLPKSDCEVSCYQALITSLQQRKRAILAAAAAKVAQHDAAIRAREKGPDKQTSGRVYVRIRDHKGTFSLEWRAIGFARNRTGRAWRRDTTIAFGEGSQRDLRRLLAHAAEWERPAVLELATQLLDYRREWHYLTQAQRDILRAKEVLGIPDFYLFSGDRPAAPPAPAPDSPADPPAAAPPAAANSPYSPTYLRGGEPAARSGRGQGVGR